MIFPLQVLAEAEVRPDSQDGAAGAMPGVLHHVLPQQEVARNPSQYPAEEDTKAYDTEPD